MGPNMEIIMVISGGPGQHGEQSDMLSMDPLTKKAPKMIKFISFEGARAHPKGSHTSPVVPLNGTTYRAPTSPCFA